MMVESIILPKIGEKSRFLFCNVLTYSYLCTRSPAHTSVEGRRDFCGLI